MFRNETIILTGAGASWHYGYPTGEELIEQVKTTARQFIQYYLACAGSGIPDFPEYVVGNHFGNAPQSYNLAVDQLREFCDRIEAADPVVIDYFLGLNVDLSDLGRFLVAWVILRNEESSQVRNGNWIKYLVHELTSGLESRRDLIDNKIRFITFNYDTSLERRLRNALLALSFDAALINEFHSNDRFVHVYGAVNDGSTSFVGVSTALNFQQEMTNGRLTSLAKIGTVNNISHNIQVIDPSKKIVADDLGVMLTNALFTATQIFSLGFSFDTNNVKIIGLDRVFETKKKFFFTNFGDIRSVNIRASITVLGKDDRFFGTRHDDGVVIAEKSTGNVNTALSSDFVLESFSV